MITARIPLVGFAGYSGSGKTTLLAQLIPMLKRRGMRIGLIKHSHHDFDIDRPSKDSYRLRAAGASPVLLVSKFRRAVITELFDGEEPLLADQLQFIDQAHLDLILVEGFKHEPFPKIEVYRPILDKALLFPTDPTIVAIATDDPSLSLPTSITLLDINDPATVEAFILKQFIKEHRD
jgi:molybdopterin-guanine dinucleotide biosynthesis protein B